MITSEYEKKLEKATLELHERGVRRKRSHTLLFKLLRLFGFQVRLPHYSNPKRVLMNSSLYFATLVAGFLSYVQFKSNQVNFAVVIVSALLVGCIFGVVMMLVTAYNQKKHALSSWEDL